MVVSLEIVLRAARLAEGTYTRAYTFNPQVGGAVRTSAWLSGLFLLPLLAVTIPPLLGGRPGWRRPVPYWCVWMAGWLAVYLPWPATFEYYLLPFAFGAAAFGGTVVGDVWAARRCRDSATRRRVASSSRVDCCGWRRS
jgi:hypothetical protein